MRKLKYVSALIVIVASITTWAIHTAHAIDSDVTKRTLTGIQGVNVVVEGLQPNIQKYAQKFGLQKDQIKGDVELTLRMAGIQVLTYDQWLKTPGKPFLYIVVNTHEYEKYWYAYDVRVQLRQCVMLEMNPSISTMADTWGISMTGNTNIGKLGVIKESVNTLVGKFVEAYLWANSKKGEMGRETVR